MLQGLCGEIFIPLLVDLFGFSQHQAQGTSFAVLILPIGLLAALQYYRAGHVDVTVAELLALERTTGRSGKDTIGHPRGGVDDVINAVAGACLLARKQQSEAGKVVAVPKRHHVGIPFAHGLAAARRAAESRSAGSLRLAPRDQNPADPERKQRTG